MEPPKKTDPLAMLKDLSKQTKSLAYGDTLALTAIRARAEMLFRNIAPESPHYVDHLHAIRLHPSYSPSEEQARHKAWEHGREQIAQLVEALITQIEAFPRDAAAPKDNVGRIRLICERFPKIARQLVERHDSRPTIIIEDEYDVQDLLHALLRLEFEDIRPEEQTPSYAGKSSRMDFLLKPERVVVEVKKTRKGLGGAEVGSQLIDDIGRYKSHPDCGTLVCFVYDPEMKIGNPRGLEGDLSRSTDGLAVVVIVSPS